MLIQESDRDRRAADFFAARLGPDFAQKYGPPFAAWLNGRRPFPSNFAKFLGIEIPPHVETGSDPAAKAREIRERLRQGHRTPDQQSGPLMPPPTL